MVGRRADDVEAGKVEDGGVIDTGDQLVESVYGVVEVAAFEGGAAERRAAHARRLSVFHAGTI